MHRTSRVSEVIAPYSFLQQDTLIQESRNNALWNTLAVLRSRCEIQLCRDIVMTLIFLKHVSDLWQAHVTQYQISHAAYPQLITELLKNERFVLTDETNFYTLYKLRHRNGNGERIDRALHLLEEANLGRLRDVFQEISFNSPGLGEPEQKNDVLRQLLEDLVRPEYGLHAADPLTAINIDTSYEDLIRNFAEVIGKKNSHFHTPSEVAQLMVQLVDPQEGDDICDPVCGSGSLLIKCGQWIRHKTGRGKYALYGQEAIGSSWALAKMNLFVHGEDNHKLERGNTLRNPKLLGRDGQLKRFDVIVTNLPYANQDWGYEVAEHDRFNRFGRGLPPRTKGDYGFILHMIETMKESSGRIAVIVPHGVLFRGAVEGKIRQQLIEENLLDTVIGLPEKLFYSTAIAAAILIFRRNRENKDILFVDARRHFLSGKHHNYLRQQDLDQIYTACMARKNSNHFAYLASAAEVAANDYNLNISRYVNAFSQEEPIDLNALTDQRQKIQNELSMLEKKIIISIKKINDYAGNVSSL